jgi:2-O-methyltransferase
MKGLWRIEAMLNKYKNKWLQSSYFAVRRSVGLSVISRLPWDYVQIIAEYRLHDILQIPAEKIHSIAIVGTCWGVEIPTLLEQYPCSQIHAFEPVPRYCQHLESAFRRQKRVTIYPMALGNVSGTIQLWDTERDGVQSTKRPQVDVFEQLYGKPIGSYSPINVVMQTLDSVSWEPVPDTMLDLLWIDVQGAEMDVLLGGDAILNKTRAVFAEVALHGSGYDGGCSYEDVNNYLSTRGFDLICCGFDPKNLTGNGLWVHK